MVIFNSYVKLPEGRSNVSVFANAGIPWYTNEFRGILCSHKAMLNNSGASKILWLKKKHIPGETRSKKWWYHVVSSLFL